MFERPNRVTLRLLSLATVAVTLLGCGKSFPEPWNELGLPTADLTMAFPDSDKPAITALYAPKVKLADAVANWETALGAKGFTRICELNHDDGSMNRGYENSGTKKRYLFTGSMVGNAPELRLLEVPDKIASADVCPKPD